MALWRLLPLLLLLFGVASAAPALLMPYEATDFSQVRMDDRPLSKILGPILQGHSFLLPESMLRRGTSYLGANFRLRRVLAELMSKSKEHQGPVKLGFIGGSITFGDRASLGINDFVTLVGGWLKRTFGEREIVIRNGATPGCPSAYLVMCLDYAIDPDVDVVFVEFALNDGFIDSIDRNDKTLAYERLVRRLLRLPHKPAIVLIQAMQHGGAMEPGQQYYRPFHHTLEDAYGAVAQYYDLPWLSFRDATYHLARVQKLPGFTFADLMEDHFTRLHPAERGHRVLADLVVWLIQQTAIDLVLRPWGREDAAQMAEQIPRPMNPGNEVTTSSMCLRNEQLRELVQADAGWKWVNEGTEIKPKWGFVTTTPGSKLRFKVDTLRPGTQGKTVVSLGFLKSYEHMGQALAECLSGCSCQPTTLFALQSERDSQTHLKNLEVTQSPECVIGLTSGQGLRANLTKFKFNSIGVSDVASPEFLPHFRDGAWVVDHIFMNGPVGAR